MNKTILYLRTCLFLLLLASMVTSDSIAQRLEPRIVFESNRNGNGDIYAIDIDGNNLVQLTDSPADDGSPACSPYAKKIVFKSDRHGPPDLYMMDSDGNNIVRLTNSNWREAAPFWSPDGTKIAFTSFRAGNWEIYTMDTDGTNLMRLTNNEISETSPSWSPDGSKIAFDANLDGPFGSSHIFVMDADGESVRNLTRNKGLSLSRNPTWSPDGSRIAFDSWRDKGDIYEMTANGKRLSRLTEGKGNNVRPSYSPDGTKIVFVSDRGGDWNIYLMDTDGRRTLRLTRTPPGTEDSSPCWLFTGLSVPLLEKQLTFWGMIKQGR